MIGPAITFVDAYRSNDWYQRQLSLDVGDMLAAHHDQENLVQSHQVPAKSGSRQLAPKTPGPRYPKTPLKIPLNDENVPVTGGKGILGGGKNTATKKQALATPVGEYGRRTI